MNKSPFEIIKEKRILPLLKFNNLKKSKNLVDILVQNDLPICVVSLRNENAFKLIKILAKRKDILLGVGTVITKQQVVEVIELGAKFIVTPGFDEEIVNYCIQKNITIFPGVSTPTEIQKAFNYGIKVMKLFPIEALGGLPYLKAVSAAFNKVKFIPTGGINEINLASYIDFPSTFAIGGSWMFNSKLYGANQINDINFKCFNLKKVLENR